MPTLPCEPPELIKTVFDHARSNRLLYDRRSARFIEKCMNRPNWSESKKDLNRIVGYYNSISLLAVKKSKKSTSNEKGPVK